MFKWLFLICILFITSCNNDFADQISSTSILTPATTPELVVVDTVEPIPSTPSFHIEEPILLSQKCYDSFEEFAYGLPETYSHEPLLPTDPWQIDATFPDELMGEYHVLGLGIEVMFARSVNGNQEIWLGRPRRHLKGDIKSVLIYQPALQEWQYVSDTIEGTDVFISGIFLTNDGTIWGINTWRGDNTSPNKGPVLSKFNEETRQFEFAPGILEISFTYEQRFINVEVIVDQQNKIWVFVANDGIYYYDPISQTTSKQVDLPDIALSAPTLSADGSIYFADNNYTKLTSSNPNFRIFEGMLYQFFPDTGELIQLEIPDEPWPTFWKMFMTQTGNLWLSAVGYKDLNDNRWNLAHPDPDSFFENVNRGAWVSPNLFLESSDGLLWFNKYTDTYEGTAWYNPKTEEGCMFTNIPANIIEDSQQQLWMFADGKLYRYSLNE